LYKTSHFILVVVTIYTSSLKYFELCNRNKVLNESDQSTMKPIYRMLREL